MDTEAVTEDTPDTEVSTVTTVDDDDEVPSVLPLVKHPSIQAGAPKMKSVSVSVRVKGRHKGNVVMHVMYILLRTITSLHVATETESPEFANAAVQCNLLDAPPLQRLKPRRPQPSLDDSFITETEQDTDTDMDTSFTCSQIEDSTEYACVHVMCILSCKIMML